MAYVSGFTNDIFFSYASIDNEPDAQDVRWVSHFRNDLATALRRRLGSDVEIFFDEVGLRAYHDLDALIENARNSAAFLAVFSPSYVERQWTRDELQAFHQTAKGSGQPTSAGDRNPQANSILSNGQGLRNRASAEPGFRSDPVQ